MSEFFVVIQKIKPIRAIILKKFNNSALTSLQKLVCYKINMDSGATFESI